MGGNLSSRLAALRAEYAETLPAEVAHARADFEAIETEGAAAVERCWQRVHRIYGTAGSYELVGVSAAARRLEVLFEDHLRGSDLPPRVLTEGRRALGELEAQASLAART